MCVCVLCTCISLQMTVKPIINMILINACVYLIAINCRSGHKTSSHTNSGSGSRESKSPQRTFGQFLAGRGTSSSSRRSASSHSLPPSLSSSKLADVQNWVHSTNAATAVARPPPLSPPSASGIHTYITHTLYTVCM